MWDMTSEEIELVKNEYRSNHKKLLELSVAHQEGDLFSEEHLRVARYFGDFFNLEDPEKWLPGFCRGIKQESSSNDPSGVNLYEP
jgi:hypothetical protein